MGFGQIEPEEPGGGGWEVEGRGGVRPAGGRTPADTRSSAEAIAAPSVDGRAGDIASGAFPTAANAASRLIA